MAKEPKNSIYSDEKQDLFLKKDTLGNNIATKSYDLDRSTPMSSLKDMMRDYYSPNTLLDNKTATAVVLQIDQKIPSFIETVNGATLGTSQGLVRVRVLSDARNYWIPVPKNSLDPIIGFYPLVRNNSGEEIKPGQIVQVEFGNNKNQFSSISDTGFINKVIARTEQPYLEPVIERKRTTLPARKDIKKPTAIKIDPKDTSAGKKGQELINDRSFNEKAANVAKRLGIDKQILLDIMEFESQVDPQAGNLGAAGQRFATGLIQFVPDTAIGLGTTVDNIYNMTGYQQLDLVEKYFNQFGKNTRRAGKNLKDLYLLVIRPAALNKPDSHIIGYYKGRDQRASAEAQAKYKTTSFAKVFALQNPVFKEYVVPPGVVTRGGVRKKISDWMKDRKRRKAKFTDPYAGS